MLFAFNSSIAMFISVIATFMSGLFVIFGGTGIPVPVGIALIILAAIGLAILLSSVPKLYTETLKNCNDNINGFIREQISISNRCFGKRKLSAQINLAFGLIVHDLITRADKRVTIPHSSFPRPRKR